MTPKKPGWYWFLPDSRCASPTGLLQQGVPVVVLVGMGVRIGRDAISDSLVVRFPQGAFHVDEMLGDWEPIETPERMTTPALQAAPASTVPAKGDHFDEETMLAINQVVEVLAERHKISGFQFVQRGSTAEPTDLGRSWSEMCIGLARTLATTPRAIADAAWFLVDR